LETHEITTGIFISSYKLNFTNVNEQVELIGFFQTKMLIMASSDQRPKLIDLVSGNSYKYTESVEISIEADFQRLDNIDYIVIKISDTGKGIPDDFLKNWESLLILKIIH